MVEDLLRILLEGVPPTISKRDYDAAIEGHTSSLVQSAEVIRRELMPLTILTSNYTNEARKAYVNLQTLIAILVTFLDEHLVLRVVGGAKEMGDSDVAIKQETSDDLLDVV